MTENEFKNQLLPVLAGLWRKMVVIPRKGASDFDREAAREANRHIFAILGRFEVSDAIQAARMLSSDHPDLPPNKGYGWVLDQLRYMLAGDRREVRDDPAHWSWRDECTLGHCLAAYAAGVSSGRLSPDFGDELWVARSIIGKNPSSMERDEARRILCGHISQARERMVERGNNREDVDRLMPDPNW